MTDIETDIEIGLPNITIPPTIVTDDDWDICCSKSSKEFIKYCSTLIISIIILIFCIFMICLSEIGSDNSIYFSLISSIMTLYIPAPEIGKK